MMEENNKKRIDIDIHGETLSDCCNKLTENVMDMNEAKIAEVILDLDIPESEQPVFLKGWRYGMSIAFYSIANGNIHLPEVVKGD